MSRLSQWLRTRRQPPPAMECLEALRIIHTTIAPTGYFEIGVRWGSPPQRPTATTYPLNATV